VLVVLDCRKLVLISHSPTNVREDSISWGLVAERMRLCRRRVPFMTPERMCGTSNTALFLILSTLALHSSIRSRAIAYGKSLKLIEKSLVSPPNN